MLVVVEGLDRSGKSTQTKLLAEALNRASPQSAELWKYPNRDTSIGQLINDYLLKKIELEDHAVHLLFSANRWETVSSMKQKLNAGIHLIVDRYAYSGVAYTSAKTGFDIEWCKQCDLGLPKPDLVVFMDTHASGLSSRAGFGDERYETTQFQSLVYENFRKLFALDNKENNRDTGSSCLILDAKDTIENLHKLILDKVTNVIQSNQLTTDQFNYLW